MTFVDPQRGRWIPWVFVAGMLLVVAVNGTLVVAALTTFTGVTTGHAYDRGRTYNDVLHAAARQEALGWRAEVRLDRSGLSVRVLDRDGGLLTGRLDGVLLRPLEGTELPLDFAAVGSRFWAAVHPPLPGQWEARLTFRSTTGDKLDIRQRVLVP